MISTAAVNRPTLSFQEINQEIGNMMVSKDQMAHAYTEFIDEYGTFHRFYSQRDYLIYVEDRNLELIGRKS